MIGFCEDRFPFLRPWLYGRYNVDIFVINEKYTGIIKLKVVNQAALFRGPLSVARAGGGRHYHLAYIA